jgi:hypothetical protein
MDPQKTEKNIFVEDSIQERKAKLEERKRSLRSSIRCMAETFENVQRDYEHFLDNGWDPENIEENERVLKRTASNTLSFLDYYLRHLQFKGFKCEPLDCKTQ